MAGIIGLVSGNGLCWYSPARTPVFANEFAQFLLDRTSTLSPSRIMAGSALIMLTADVADIIAGHRAYLLGPIVVEANNQLADDELRLTLPEDPNPVLVEYFAPGLSPLDLETYSSLRRSGLSQDDALHAVALLDARHKSEHV